MPDNHHTSASILGSTDPHDDPVKALVMLWHACFIDDTVFECGLDREECEHKAVEFFDALAQERPIPVVPPAAALMGLDRYCHSERQGVEPEKRLRQVELADATYRVLELANERSSRYSIHRPNFKEYWVKWHHIFPSEHGGYKIEVPPIADPVSINYPLLAMAGGFDDGVSPSWLPEPQLRCATLTNSQTRWASVLRVLLEAQAEKIEILVLPELTVDNCVLKLMQAWLQDQQHSLKLVVAGSFHIDDGDTWRNRSWILGHRGNLLFYQDKLRPYRHKRGSDEKITAGNTLRVLNCPLGLVAVGICLDFCETDVAAIATIWGRSVGPSLVLVPSMGGKNTLEKHASRAVNLALIHSTRVVVALQDEPDLPKCDRVAPCGVVHWPPNETETNGPFLRLTIP